MQDKQQQQFIGCIKTPSLFDEIEIGECFHTNDSFEPLAVNIPKNQVLGKRVEAYFHSYLDQQEQIEILQSNLQIIENKQTLGEIDYIVQDDNETKHIELVYKFYLYDESVSENEIERWIGPNRKDSLVFKLGKLENKQFPLLQHSRTKELIAPLDPKNIQSSLCFKAQLYIPYGTRKQYPIVNNDCIVGQWLFFDQFNEEQFSEYLFHIPEKQNWLIDAQYAAFWEDYSTTLNKIKLQHQNKRAPMVFLKNGDRYERLFIVWW